ncbi:MAG: malate dehydrogenase, partial [Candidatus Thermoplasmatota archaeon]|nr:malate dehydrogenase [Candidatus Thermoplasmatota archaeon]
MKISFIGAGRLGSIIAYSTVLREFAQEVVMVDIIEPLARGQANDLRHAMEYKADMSIRMGGYEDIRDSDIIVVTAGKPRAPGMTRLDLLDFNAPIMRDVAEKVGKLAPHSVMINLTNPMDVMNYVAYKYSGFERTRIIGSGGMLDTARFRTALSDFLSVPANRIEAYVLGEHGDSQVPVWSKVKVDGEARSFTEDERKRIREEIKEVAINIISGKKATEFGPANCTADMIQAVAEDGDELIPSSIVVKGEYDMKDISIGMPVVLGEGGVKEILEWDLDPAELEEMQASGEVLTKGRED